METVAMVWETVKDFFVESKNVVCEYLEDEVTRTHKETVKTGAIIFLLGIIIGFLFAPIRKGLCIASNNVNSFDQNTAKAKNEQKKQMKHK